MQIKKGINNNNRIKGFPELKPINILEYKLMPA